MFSEVYPLLFARICGEDEDFSSEYYLSLMEQGILRKEEKQFEKETEMQNEAVEIPGKDLVLRDMSDENFESAVRAVCRSISRPRVSAEVVDNSRTL
jgi:hypothetical protein